LADLYKVSGIIRGCSGKFKFKVTRGIATIQFGRNFVDLGKMDPFQKIYLID